MTPLNKKPRQAVIRRLAFCFFFIAGACGAGTARDPRGTAVARGTAVSGSGSGSDPGSGSDDSYAANVMQTIGRYRSTVTDCYKDGLKHDDPGLKGKLVIRFTIDVHGSVTSALVSFVDAKVADCVERVVKMSWVFAPNADNEGPFEVNFMLAPS